MNNSSDITTFFSNICVYNATDYQTIITRTMEDAHKNYQSIVANSNDENIRSKISIHKVCRFMSDKKQHKLCMEKGVEFYKFFN
jgi:hypothetical protein